MVSPNQEADMKNLRAEQCSNEAVRAGAKAAAIACVASAIPTLLGARAIPWARANLNHAAQALIISTLSGSAYFIVADRTILESARRNSFREQMENHADYWPF
jgi:hypothetical protein